MRKILSLLVSSTLLAATTLVAISSPQAFAAPTLTTCTNLETGKTLVLRSTEAECRSHLGSALWVQEQSDSPSRTSAGYASITICSSKNPLSTYRFIKDSCPYFQVSTNYWRTVAPPATPIIQTASARGHDSAALFITPATSAPSAPVLYYLVTDMKSGLTSKVRPGNLGHLYLSGLSAESTYTFTIAAVSVDGTSVTSLATPSIKTSAAPVVITTAPIALTCATGGTCVVGDRGPGGGIVFYVATTPFACGPTRSSTCRYLEAAPSGWNGVGDPQLTWAQSTPVDYQSTPVNNASSPETATATAIGWGYWNTRAVISQGNTDTATSAAALADTHTVTVSGVLFDDWYLPSKDELNALYLQKTLVGGFVEYIYWSSSEIDAELTWSQDLEFGFQAPWFTKAFPFHVRPVRAF